MRKSNARQRRRALALIRLNEATEVLDAWESAAQRLAGPGAPAGRRRAAAAQLDAARAHQVAAAAELVGAD